MLNLEGKAEITKLSIDKIIKGEQATKVATVKLRLPDVTLEAVETGFVSQLNLVFKDDGAPALIELGPLQVSRQVVNVSVTLCGVVMHGLDISKIKLTPKAGFMVDVECELKGEVENGVVDSLWLGLHEVSEIKLDEKQLELAPAPAEAA